VIFGHFIGFVPLLRKLELIKVGPTKVGSKRTKVFSKLLFFYSLFRKPAISNKELFWTKKSKFKISKVYKDRD